MSQPIRRRGGRAALAYLAGLALASLFVFPLGSCTALLGVSGMYRDMNHPAPGVIPRGLVAVVHRGAPMMLRLADSTILSGKYLGTTVGDLDDYRPAYDGWRSSRVDSAGWPTLGARLMTASPRDPPWLRSSGRFEGFTVAGFIARHDGGRRDTAELPLDEIQPVVIGNIACRQLDLRRGIESGMPLRTRLRIRSVQDGRVHAVPWSDVVDVTIGEARHSARNGVLVGIVVDAALVAVVHDAMSRPKEPQGCDPGSEWEPWIFASRAPGDYDTVTGRFVTRDEARALAAARAARGMPAAPAPVPVTP